MPTGLWSLFENRYIFRLYAPNPRAYFSLHKAIVTRPCTNPWTFFLRAPGTVDIRVSLLESYEPITPNVIAQIELGRKDQWRSIGNGEGREISVFRAFLRGVVVHRGIRCVEVSSHPFLY